MNYLDYIMKGFHNSDEYLVEQSSTAFGETILRNLILYIVSVIHQLQASGVMLVGEVSLPSHKNNVYKIVTI